MFSLTLPYSRRASNPDLLVGEEEEEVEYLIWRMRYSNEVFVQPNEADAE